MRINRNILWLTQTALLVALLVSWQAVSRPLGQVVTGTGVNFILVIATVICSARTGLSVGLLSPVMAQLFGIAPPFWVLVPFIVLGNIVLVSVWSVISSKHRTILSHSIATVVAALLKFAVLYLGVVVIVGNFLLPTIPPKILKAFFLPQLLTASIGGALATAAIPIFNRLKINQK